MPSANANTRAAGWRFSRDHDKWARVDAADAEPVGSLGTSNKLRLATFNCLHDWTLGDVLQHEVRHDAICQELAALNADVIGLNEVTRSLLERVLREVAESYDETFAGSAAMTFPGVVALSHCWLALDHPDPAGRNLREKWLPAVEWYFSERVRRACDARDQPGVSAAMRSAFEGVSDAELLERCDFGIFIECARAARTRAAPPRPDATRPRSSRGLAA